MGASLDLLLFAFQSSYHCPEALVLPWAIFCSVSPSSWPSPQCCWTACLWLRCLCFPIFKHRTTEEISLCPSLLSVSLCEHRVKQEPQDALLKKKKKSILTIIGRREAAMGMQESRSRNRVFFLCLEKEELRSMNTTPRIFREEDDKTWWYFV